MPSLPISKKRQDRSTQKSRQVPYALREKADLALQYWVTQISLQPIMFSEWAHPVVYREKGDDTVGLCADIKAEINKFGNVKYYTKLDLRAAYMHQQVKKEFQQYLVINTYKGL